MSFDYRGENTRQGIPVISASDLKLDWIDTGKFFHPLEDTNRTLDAVSSWFWTFKENQLNIDTETELLKDTGINPTGTRTRKEVQNILYWRDQDKKEAYDISRSTAPKLAVTAQIASAFLNPVEVAVGVAATTVPPLGGAYLAAKVAKVGTTAGRIKEAAKIGAIQNTAIGLGFEPLNYAVETTYGYDYGLDDSLVNVAVNTAFGALFGGSYQAFKDRKGFGKTHEQRIWNELPQRSKVEIADAINNAIDKNISLKTDDIVKIAKADRFFRYASKEGEGEGGFYDKVRAGFLKEVFHNRPYLKSLYHEMNLNRITKGKQSVLRLDYEVAPRKFDINIDTQMPLFYKNVKQYQRFIDKEVKQFTKVVDLNEKYQTLVNGIKKLSTKERDEMKTIRSRHSGQENLFYKAVVEDIDKQLSEHNVAVKTINKVKETLQKEIDKLNGDSQWLFSAMQTEGPLLSNQKKTLNNVLEAEHIKDSNEIISDLKTIANDNPLEPDVKYEIPETPMDKYDIKPENYGDSFQGLVSKYENKKIDNATQSHIKKLNDELNEIDAEVAWIDKVASGDCDA